MAFPGSPPAQASDSAGCSEFPLSGLSGCPFRGSSEVVLAQWCQDRRKDTPMTTVYERRAAPAVAPPARRSPAGVVLALLWAGAAAVLALWWTDTGSVVGTA